MPKLPELKPKQIEQILHRAGFLLDHQKGSHRTYLNPETNKYTTIAFHPGTIPKGTLRAIISQTGLSPEEFLNLHRKNK